MMNGDETLQHATYRQFTDVVNGAKRSTDAAAAPAAAAAPVYDC